MKKDNWKDLNIQSMIRLKKYNQYKFDIFSKLNFQFESGKQLLDVGCGDGIDAQIFIDAFKLKTFGIDVYKDKNIKNIKKLTFKKAGIYEIPYKQEKFDYVFLHDVLHHIDEKKQSYKKHIEGLNELKRVTKQGGYIIIVEGNRYNPLFYPHMVKHFGHEHFRQSYFKKIVLDIFPQAEFIFFESHFYPRPLLSLFKVYEKMMEMVSPRRFLAYNVAIIKKTAKV